ncbi:MAG: hypothetical protein ACFCVD_06525 [Nodosilinea sp.]
MASESTAREHLAASDCPVGQPGADLSSGRPSSIEFEVKGRVALGDRLRS